MHRTIAIGDIHGCSTALQALIAALDPQPADQVVTLGDYLNRGPDSRGVLEQLLALAGRCRLVPLLGNHEEMLFAALESASASSALLSFGGDRTLRSYGEGAELSDIPPRHLEFLRNCRRYHETESHLFVHANYWPNLPFDQQPATALLWEPLDPDRAAPHYSGKPVVLGHTPQEDGQVLNLGFLQCIDTNCCDGGWLTALEVTSGHCWQANQQGEVREVRLRQRPVH